MARRALILVPLLAFMVASGSAQDARAVLRGLGDRHGPQQPEDDPVCSRTGWNALVGQSFNLTEDWPRFEVTAYSRTIDYDANVGVEDFTRRRGSYPMRGGGAPFDGDQRVVQVVSGGFAWNMQGEKPALPGGRMPKGCRTTICGSSISSSRRTASWPAMAAKDTRVMSTAIVGPTNAGLTENGRRANLVTLGKYRSSARSTIRTWWS